jgi:hypothetical protein
VRNLQALLSREYPLTASVSSSPTSDAGESKLLSFSLADDRPVSRPLLLSIFAIICLLYGLLWSPWWYPLSDSSLYLIMARGLMEGRGFGFLRQIHRDVRPLTPLLLYAIMKCGGGIGAMNAAMSILTLLSHVLAFLTLRKWFNERVALFAVVATAASWWVFANAFTIMTEPLFLVMFWASMLTLYDLNSTKPARQWLRLIIGILFAIGAFENRIAAVLLLPGIYFGLWMQNSDTPRSRRILWLLVFTLLFCGALWEWKRWGIKYPVSAETSGVLSSAESGASGPESYKANVLVGIHNPLIQLPVSAGRWVLEALAAAFQVPFNGHLSPLLAAAAGIFAFLIFLITCAGWFWLIYRKRWYAVGMAAYFFPYWIAWGSRIKPRYMMPILPLIFIQLWAGSMLLIALLRRKRADSPACIKRRSTVIAAVLLVGVIILNAPPYAIDWFVRHGTPMNFYDVARRGACAELVDIGAYVNKNAKPSAELWMNWSPNRRIAHFLCNRETHPLPGNKKKTPPDIDITSPSDEKDLARFFHRVEALDPRAEWAIVFYSQYPWPDYHWPHMNKISRTEQTPARYWELFHRDPAGGNFRAVTVPVDRNEVRGIPGVDIGR